MKRTSLFIAYSIFLLAVADFIAPAATASPGLHGQSIHGPRLHGPGDGSVKDCCEKLMNSKRSIYYLNDWRYKIAFQLRSVYTRDETMFFCLSLRNHSHIDYPIDSVRFYIADAKRPRDTPLHGIILSPLCIYGNTSIVRGKTMERCVFALRRFTLPDRKMLVIDVTERNGGRHLQLLANNFTLVRARLI